MSFSCRGNLRVSKTLYGGLKSSAEFDFLDKYDYGMERTYEE
jgi:hypothetical protein